MKLRRAIALALALFAPVAAGIVSSFGCASTTGTKKIPFEAFAGGTSEAARPFVNAKGFEVTLRRADLVFGPIYLNVIAPRQGITAGLMGLLEREAFAAGEDHLGSGRVVGEVLGQVRVDALNDALVPFPVPGVATNEGVRTADVWFFPPIGQDPDTPNVPPALVVEGTAARGGRTVAFRGALVFDETWLPEAAIASREARTLADIRRVRGIAAQFVPDDGGRLVVRFDVRALFRGADFDALAQNPADADGTKRLVQGRASGVDQVMTNLFQGIKSTTGPWLVRWEAAP